MRLTNDCSIKTPNEKKRAARARVLQEKNVAHFLCTCNYDESFSAQSNTQLEKKVKKIKLDLSIFLHYIGH